MAKRPNKFLLENVTFGSAVWAMKDEPGFIAVDSRGDAAARYSIIASNPTNTFSFSGAFVTQNGHTKIDSPSRAFDEFLRTVNDLPFDPYLPFAGGAIGYIGFEGIRALKGFEPAKGFSRFPQCYFGIYNSAIIFDHVEGVCFGVGEKHLSLRASMPKASGRSNPANSLDCHVVRLRRTPRNDTERLAQEWIRAEKLKCVCLAKKGRVAMPDAHPLSFMLEPASGKASAIISHGAAFASVSSSDITVQSDGVFVKAGFGKEFADEYRAIFERLCVPGSISLKDRGDKVEISGRRLLGLKWASVPMEIIPSVQTSGSPRDNAISFIAENEKEPRGFFGGVFGYFDSERMCLRTIDRATTFADGTIETTSPY